MNQTVILWVTILTPAACLILYAMTCFLDKDKEVAQLNRLLIFRQINDQSILTI